MFLLRTKNRSYEFGQIYDVFEEAVEEARKFVGDHNEADSCSTPRHEHRSDRPYFCARRSTSFGQRVAQVSPISANDRLELFPW